MDNDARFNRLQSKIKTSRDIPVFSDAQIEAFYSGSVDSLDETLAVLDETNQTTVGEPKEFLQNNTENNKSGS